MPQMLTDHLLHADVGNVLWPLTLACCISVSLAASTVDGDDKSMSLQEIKTQRKTLAQRPRRIIFNNDGDDPGPPGTVTREKLLANRTTALLGSHVDAIWYYSTWGMKLHHQDGPFGELYACQYEPAGARMQVENYRKILAETGKDTLEIMIDVCRQNDLEIFYANRMNDIHDSFFDGIMYNIKLKHPEWCLSTRAEGKKYNYPDVRSCWTAWNFEVAQIRRLTVEAMREVCQTYDIDGIELDFWRQSLYFAESMQHKPVTPDHLELMNDMVRQIRQAADAEGRKRGRPILLAGRCLEDVTISKNSGMDVETWLEEDLVDILSVAYSTEHTAPLHELIKLAHRYGVPVYPISNSFHKTEVDDAYKHEGMLGNLPVWRGDALNVWAQGADGMQMFNFFEPDKRQWWELGEPDQLRTLDRTYVWDFLPSQRQGHDTFAQMRITRHRWPVTVTTQGCEPMPLYVGEDLSAPDKTGKARKLTLRVLAKNLKVQHGLKVLVNGRALGQPAFKPQPKEDGADVWLHYTTPAELFGKGENPVTASVGDEAGGGPSIDQIRLDVRYE